MKPALGIEDHEMHTAECVEPYHLYCRSELHLAGLVHRAVPNWGAFPRNRPAAVQEQEQSGSLVCLGRQDPTHGRGRVQAAGIVAG